ncbi:SDR family oxidoreductase [Aspergillus fijiensis CBS 313.89]|uniref:Putative short chain-type dehydrogenase n=1 Tax=Aspergillus fijiensis CBS 313.89 TaxID=1448319 RepID=A0A8G1VUZ2_9EURO|nr:putative short chain-type dehydrogenase [Aspergillus fijiensis CBS 313.89]RAK73950.1 putative short chain-type dehydrogenase [Aspergillus fijiensis CBS 313.89]
MSTILITGSSRGLGLELVQQFAALLPENGLIIAAARNITPALEEVIAREKGRVAFVALDITDEASVVRSAEEVRGVLGDRKLEILVNCAGVIGETQEKAGSSADLDFTLSVNVTGTHNVTRSYLPLMQGASVKKVVNISSQYGSMARARANDYAKLPAYKVSKAALNALTVQYALSYEADGFVFMAVHPGWLQTDMGGSGADLTVSQGAKAVLEVIVAADEKSNGTFRNIYVGGSEIYRGEEIPW